MASGPPTADFVYSIDHFTVSFSDQSSDIGGNISVWQWDFGDNSTSPEQNPTHEYPEEGVYTVSLTVIDDDGNSANMQKTITLEKEEDGGGIPGFTSVFFLLSFIVVISVLMVHKKKKQ